MKYVAANGARMENLGEKRPKFKRIGSDEVSGITFQVTEVSKPLASVSRISGKGNREAQKVGTFRTRRRASGSP